MVMVKFTYCHCYCTPKKAFRMPSLTLSKLSRCESCKLVLPSHTPASGKNQGGNINQLAEEEVYNDPSKFTV